jgi:hypothetical protein
MKSETLNFETNISLFNMIVRVLNDRCINKVNYNSKESKKWERLGNQTS